MIICLLMIRRPPGSRHTATLFPSTTCFRAGACVQEPPRLRTGAAVPRLRLERAVPTLRRADDRACRRPAPAVPPLRYSAHGATRVPGLRWPGVAAARRRYRTTRTTARRALRRRAGAARRPREHRAPRCAGTIAGYPGRQARDPGRPAAEIGRGSVRDRVGTYV